MIFSILSYYTLTFSWLMYVLPFVNMFALWLLLKKLGRKEINAFIPVVNSMEQFEIGWTRTAGILYALMVIAGYASFLGLKLIADKEILNEQQIAMCFLAGFICFLWQLVLAAIMAYKTGRVFGKSTGESLLIMLLHPFSFFYLAMDKNSVYTKPGKKKK